MSEASFASLGPRLLARKGGAKPAMRPQVAPLPDEIANGAAQNIDQLDDLGWNDMGAGHECEAAPDQSETSAEIVPIPVKAPASAATAPKGAAAKKPAKSTKRAAFTLRLDTDRHLKLRLASTMQGVSAQALVTQALDALLDDIADLDALAERMKRS